MNGTARADQGVRIMPRNVRKELNRCRGARARNRDSLSQSSRNDRGHATVIVMDVYWNRREQTRKEKQGACELYNGKGEGGRELRVPRTCS